MSQTPTMYEHLFWDMGGTLVDTYPQLDESFVRVVREHGREVAPLEVARLTRRSTAEAIADLSSRFGIDASAFEQAHDELKARWEREPAPVMPGARELLADVRAAGGLNLLVTHRDRASAQSLLDGLGLVVDDLISTADGFDRKPAPDMYLELLRRHGLDPDECLAVGDRPIDALAAHAAGIRAATLESPDAPVDDEGDFEIAALDQLRPLLGLPEPA